MSVYLFNKLFFKVVKFIYFLTLKYILKFLMRVVYILIKLLFNLYKNIFLGQYNGNKNVCLVKQNLEVRRVVESEELDKIVFLVQFVFLLFYLFF